MNDAGTTAPAGTGTGRRIAFNHDLLSGLALIILGSFAYTWGPGWGERTWVFPNMVSWLMVGLGILLAVIGLARRTREKLFESWRAAVDVSWFSASVLAFFLLIPQIGYFVATWLFMVVQASVLGGRRHPAAVGLIIVVAGLLALGMYQLFGGAFNVHLPEGRWI
ncbi:tripartite tricarboxylate transporter TctB family protein [Actinobacteria bacterium YIM 96077]|uniref:DUF1468 domain-containing protein n=1 Tax=Phytoactinopolyspora halophila TaxID=1981511 RepID=A0A329QNI5_9ACTN|nr:tripartite tricarboxylate transporter TctB family protein [Phytoactinopolyspora halophila]AYY12270.1 tripartite tricarboxylate transporter TctB family protein [Actinobacteria bacterium YIM 96077]RAW13813.1 hypothetical protein DPM12_12485 [Phytoactinopolyspora halophila]